MSDYRIKFITNITGYHLVATDQNWFSSGGDNNVLEQFLESPKINTLYAVLKSDNKENHVNFVTEVPSECDRVLIFHKIRPTSVTEENLHEVLQILSLKGTPTLALYHTLNNVFSPLIKESNKEKNIKNVNLQRQLASLQAGLRTHLISNDQNKTVDENSDSLAVILTLEHEVEYWNNVVESSKNKTTAMAYRDMLRPLSRDFSVIETLSLPDVEDNLENAHNILDDLWRHDPPYPKVRMKHLMEIIALEVINYISQQLIELNVWTCQYSSILEVIEQCIAIGERWISICHSLTHFFWPNYSLHPWQEAALKPQYLCEVVERLKKIIHLRTAHYQLMSLLTQSEQEDLNTTETFKPFKELDILECGSYIEPKWQASEKRFEQYLLPAEKRIAAKLKLQLASVNTNTRQLLYEFGRYSELISRPVVNEVLRSERQLLMTTLNEYLGQLTNQISTDLPTKDTESSQFLEEITKLRGIESKAMEIQQISSKLLTDLLGYENFQNAVDELLKDLKQQHTDMFDSWTQELTLQIKNKSLSLQESDPVVQFSARQLMQVNYSPRLLTLINEVKQLSAMGYRIPANIQQTAEHAQKFMHHAKALEQIANFHNTIGDRMIKSQKLMMLSSALELSKLVQEQEVVHWGEVEAVEKYVKSLSAVVDKLSRENNLLAAYHKQILEKISELEETDLLRHLHKWKDAAKSFRDIMTTVEEKGFSNMQSWKLDIDRQLCAALESQYRKSLDTLHLVHLPEITADLIYRQNILQLSPAEDILRERYNQQLKRFLDIPKSFRGVSEVVNGSVFVEIIENTKDLQENVAVHTEQLFEQLRGVVKHWQSWLSLETLDTTKLTSWENWELHFRASKTFGQEVAKLPSNEERVGCFLIGLSWLRSDLEAHNRSYWSQLVMSLKDSVIQDVGKLQEYVDASTATLHRQPLTYEQIGEAGASHKDIMNQATEMQELYKEMQRKNKLLLNWTRERVDSVGRLQGGWERMQNLLENHQHIIAKQMETIKTTLNIACENVNSDIERFAAKWEQVKSKPGSNLLYFESIDDLQKHLEILREKRIQWDEIYAQKEKIMGDYDKFNFEVPAYFTDEMCNEIQKDLESNEKMWSLFEEFQGGLEKMCKEEWIVFRKKIYKFEEFLTEWRSRLEKVEPNSVITRMMQEINKFLDTIPNLKYVRGEDFTEKHWLDVFTLLNITPKPIDIICLKDFLDAADLLEASEKELQGICKKAASEIVVRQALAELDQWDIQTRFILIPHTDSQDKTIMLIKDFKEILNKIGDNQSLLQSVKNSADYDSFSERAGLWEVRLADLDHYLTNLAQIQRKWLYLEPIFISGTMIQEKSRFERLDKDFRHILASIDRDPRLTALCRYPNLRSILEHLKDQLSRCQHSLDNFLTDKRTKFPRFLFLGDDDLLEIVGQSSKEQIIQNHLRKLFAGIHSIQLSDSKISAICSLQGEVLPLVAHIDISQPVEDWLNVLVLEMQNTLRQSLLNNLADEQMGKPLNPLLYPSQILCLSDSINFTKNCERAISNNTLNQLLVNYKNQLIQTSSMAMSYGKDSSVGGEVSVLELKLNALILDNIHHIAVVQELVDKKVAAITDWYWQKQLRYYSESDGNVAIKMVNATMKYSFEYLGNAQKLVRTPLTDQCFLTLTQGMHLGMGGNPYGPAGTGKTETVKALGALLGRQVLVFNCDEGIDTAAMGRILSGLVRCGAWGCFDEFNRLDEATLSAISMQIQPIQMALRKGLSTVRLLDADIEVNRFCGIFVTMNPAGGGYGGRNKLPDNLKQLFRPVVMLQPDHEQIASTLLYCDGYQFADVLGKKLVEIFSLSNMLLSKQKHYDWGLRALRTVLSGCGRAMKQYHNNSKSNSEQDDLKKTEMQLVVGALRMDTLSKLTYADTERFDSLVQDVFPDVPFVSTGFEQLTNALEESCTELGYQVDNRQISKCLELYEQLHQRMGVALVGPASSGKSTLRKILFHALSKLDKNMKQHVFNPKSMTRQQLLGQIDLDTRQWTDGVLTSCALAIVAETSDVWSWVICDGDVDPEWIESLNSVLDDNRLLTLPSGWRIQFGPNVNFIFETHDLSFASPATVSRLGIVFLSEEDLNIDHYISRWLSNQPENVERILTLFINDYFKKCIDWIKTEGDLSVACSKVGVTSTGLSQLHNVTGKPHLTVALINGLGGLLTPESKEIFAQYVLQLTNENIPSSVPLLRCRYNADRDLIDAYRTDLNPVTFDPDEGLPLILTGRVLQVLDVLNVWFAEGEEKHFLLIGPHGSAKSLILKHLVRERNDIDMTTIYCSANITPRYILHKLSLHCMVVSSNRGRVYIPKKRHLILNFKHLHLLKSDRWGTNIVIAFLHQLITYGGFYDSNLEWVSVEKVSIVATLDRSDNISPRFTSIVHCHNIDLPEMEDLNLIVMSHLISVINKYLPNHIIWSNKSKVQKISAAMLSTYDTVKNTFTTSQQQHYNFSPHDLTKWCGSISRYVDETEDVGNENWLFEVIAHEAFRIFKDKLVNEADRASVESILITSMQQSNCGKSSLVKDMAKFYFVPNILNKQSKLAKLSTEDWSKSVEKGIIQFGREGQTLNVLIVPELLLLTATLGRALTEIGGCALLVGKSGVGRRSALRIISALQSTKLITIFTSKTPQFNLEIKNAMHLAGVEGEQIYLLFEDHVMKDEKILDMVNTVLYSGEIPGLYNHAEIDSLAAGLRDEAERENYEGDLIQFFIERVRRNLHIIVCLESDNTDLWKILTVCPALCQKCTVIWLDEWSKQTLQAIPKMIASKIDYKNKINSVDLPDNLYLIQDNIDSHLVTPRRYITLLEVFLKIYLEKRTAINAKQIKLQAGVTKLTEAKNIVAELKKKAAEQQIQLAEKQEKANAALDMISNTMKNANSHKQEMETLKHQTELENEQLVKRKKEIELELAEVEPLIQEARAAVGNIKPEALSEIRSLRAPPDTIRDILEAVLRLMGTQDTSWNSMKTFLAKRGVKEDIRAFDASKIYTENRQAVERLLANRGESFDPKAARRASVAAAPLASWVTANVRYSYVLDKIKPLAREQAKLQQNLSNAQLHLGELSAGLSDVDATVAKLKDKLSTYTKEAAEIEIRLTAAQDTLTSAEGLVAKLNDEFERWQMQLKEMSAEVKELPLKCLLAAAFIVYLANEPEDQRLQKLQEWTSLLYRQPTAPEFNFEGFLGSERQQIQWQMEGLSNDKLSIQNALIILNTNAFPLLLDSSSVALQWLNAHLKNKNVEKVSQNSPKFVTNLELAVRFGKILIIEEVESIPPILFPILRNDFLYQGERKLVFLNGKLIDFHADFQLFFCSRNTHLKLSADALSVINVVNFRITHAGLTEQLLNEIIRQESPQMEERRRDLLRQQEELEEKQYKLQNQLLEDLANSSGDILQNKDLLASLNKTKASSSAIAAALKESSQIQAQLQTEYDVYRDISIFGSSLYFAVTEFSSLNVLYTLSVPAFTKLFLKAVPSVENIKNGSINIQRLLVQALFQYYSRSLFKTDYLGLGLHLIHKMFPTQVPDEEWQLFIGNVSVKNEMFKEPLPQWIPGHCINAVNMLKSALLNLYNSLNLNDQTQWQQFMQDSECEKHFPANCKLTEFQRVLVIQCLRTDRLHSALILCVLHLTGLKQLSPDVLQLTHIYKETIATEPILFLIESGTDPSVELRELASTVIEKDKYVEIAMGEGQEEKALRALEEATDIGQWLTLKNLHLVTSWLPILCQKLQSIKTYAQDFRLWLVTELHASFSSVLAQSSLKIAYEAPQGIKINLHRSLVSWGREYLEKQGSNGAKILFAIACVHALLQERRTYIPQGWLKYYEFSDVDLSTAVQLCEETWKSNRGAIQWKHIQGLCKGAVYGGRIEHSQDVKILETYLKQYFNEDTLSHRWKPFGTMLSLPISANFEDYKLAISKLDSRDLPTYFGLPDNIERAWETNTSNNLIMKLKGLDFPITESSKYIKEEWIKGLHPLMSLWKKLNQGKEWLHIPLPNVSKQGSPISIFLSEEARFAVNLVQQIHKCFANLNKVIKSNVAPDQKMSLFAKEILCNQTPILWQNIWDGPKDVVTYIRSAVSQLSTIMEWNKPNGIVNILEKPLNLAALFNPAAFLSALKQQACRDNGVAMDELILQTTWMLNSKRKGSIQITGLYIEGAIFNGHNLMPCKANSDTINSIPDCLLTWTPIVEKSGLNKYFEVPFYFTSERSTQLAHLQIPCDNTEKDKWIQAAVAVFLTF